MGNPRGVGRMTFRLARSVAGALAIALTLATISVPAHAGAQGSASRRLQRLDARLRDVAAQRAPDPQRVIIRARPGYRPALQSRLRAHGDRILVLHDSLDALTAVIHGEDLAALADND